MKWTGEQFKGKYYIGTGCDGSVQLSETCIAVENKWSGCWWVKKDPSDKEPIARFETKSAAVRWCMVN